MLAAVSNIDRIKILRLVRCRTEHARRPRGLHRLALVALVARDGGCGGAARAARHGARRVRRPRLLGGMEHSGRLTANRAESGAACNREHVNGRRAHDILQPIAAERAALPAEHDVAELDTGALGSRRHLYRRDDIVRIEAHTHRSVAAHNNGHGERRFERHLGRHSGRWWRHV